jgi:hypothetical protein
METIMMTIAKVLMTVGITFIASALVMEVIERYRFRK